MKHFILALLLLPTLTLADQIHFEAGAANASGEWTGAHYIRISSRFNDDKWALGIAHVEEQNFNTCPPWDCSVHTYRQLFVDVTRYVKWKKIELGVGPSVAQNSTRVTPAKINVHLSLGLRVKNWSLTVHHYSNAGTSPTGFNMGQDALTIGYAF